MIYLSQAKILKLLKTKKVKMSRDELRGYLKANWDKIAGLELNHHENVDRNNRNNHWYEIVSDVSQDEAHRIVAKLLSE